MRSFFAPFRAALFSCALVGLATIAAAPARAAFLIDPTGGTSLTAFTSSGTADLDDGSLVRSLGGNFSLYGTNLTSVFVQVDGFLSTADGFGFLADRSVGALAGVIPGSVISPYYDDLFLRTAVSNSIVEKVVAGSYYSATYTINGFTDTTAPATAKFQTVLFTGNTTINGNSFLAGDIVFSYGAMTNTVQGNFSVGVAQNAANATNAFGATGGQFATNTLFLSNFNSATQGLLFRGGSGGGTYTQSLVSLVGGGSAAPEPGSFVLLAMGGLPLMGLVARRRKAS